jgi:hypothetical protein
MLANGTRGNHCLGDRASVTWVRRPATRLPAPLPIVRITGQESECAIDPRGTAGLRTSLTSSSKEFASDDFPLDLRGTLVDPRGANLAIEML